MAQQPKIAEVRQPGPKSPLWLRIGFWICIVISVAVVLRVFALSARPQNGPPQMAALDDVFASHAALTYAHIVPALLFVLLTPAMVFRRASRPAWIDRVFYLIGAVVGLTAYAMSTHSVGGWTERSAVLLFNSLFLFSLSRAYVYRSASNFVLERRWQLRAIAILLGIATTRPVMGVFFATAPKTHLVPAQFFGIAFWIGFAINVLIFEFWIRSADRHRVHASNSQIHPSPLRSGI